MSIQGHELDDPGRPYGPVVFGCGNFGGIGGDRDFVGKGIGEEASLASMDEAADLGITLFDTAERYADGASERIVGRWLAARPSSVTERIRISTKVGPPWVDDRDGRFDLEYIDRLFSGSLERRTVDAVDVLYTHAPRRPPTTTSRLRTGRDRGHARSPRDDPSSGRIGSGRSPADNRSNTMDGDTRLG